MHRLLVTANVVPSSQIPVTLIMKALRSTETSALTKATQRAIPEAGILQFSESFKARRAARRLLNQ
jgi:hypothetical protein